jgi:hypothetical protein
VRPAVRARPVSRPAPLPSPTAGLRIKETKEVFEGQLTELTPVESESALSGYGKTISHVVIGLKTAKGVKQLKLDPSIYESIQKEKVVVGDVIYIEANSGAVKVRQRVAPSANEGTQSLLRARSALAVATSSPPSSILRPRSTSLCPRAQCTRRRRSCRT